MDGNIQRYVLKLYGLHMYKASRTVVKRSLSHGNCVK